MRRQAARSTVQRAVSREAEELFLQHHRRTAAPPSETAQPRERHLCDPLRDQACRSLHDAARRGAGAFFTPQQPVQHAREAHTHSHTHSRWAFPPHTDQTPFMPKCTCACARASYLDPDITVGSQGRVVQTSRGSFADRPLEGGRRPQHDVPPKFQQGYGGAESTVTVNQRPVPQNSDVQRESDQK